MCPALLFWARCDDTGSVARYAPADAHERDMMMMMMMMVVVVVVVMMILMVMML